MNLINDVANLITIRNFLLSSVDNLGVKLTREEVKSVQTRLIYLDKIIISNALKLNLERVGEEPQKVIKVWESTEPVEVVASAVIADTVPQETVSQEV